MLPGAGTSDGGGDIGEAPGEASHDGFATVSDALLSTAAAALAAAAAAAAAEATDVQPQPQQPRMTPPSARARRHTQCRVTQSIRDAAVLLDECRVVPRPPRLIDSFCTTQLSFLEKPIIKRRKGDDKWVTSGGRKGATQVWLTEQTGILKRYGRIVRPSSSDLKFAMFSILTRSSAEDDAPSEDKSKALWVLHALHPPVAAAAAAAAADVGGSGTQPLSMPSQKRPLPTASAAQPSASPHIRQQAKLESDAREGGRAADVGWL